MLSLLSRLLNRHFRLPLLHGAVLSVLSLLSRLLNRDLAMGGCLAQHLSVLSLLSRLLNRIVGRKASCVGGAFSALSVEPSAESGRVGTGR